MDRARTLGVGIVAALGAAAPASAAGPPTSVGAEAVRAALSCRTAPAPARQRAPVLLVPGVSGTAEERFGGPSGLLDVLPAKGIDACALTVPDASRTSLAPASEWVVAAVRELHRRGGGTVDVVSHSQGALMTRWATRWWPDVGALVDDHVALAGPVASSERRGSGQIGAGRRTLEALNRPGLLAPAVDGTAITTVQDEVVQPSSAAHYPEEQPGAASLDIQALCPGRAVSHDGLLRDAAVQALVVDALLRPGPGAPGAVRRSCEAPAAAATGLATLGSLVQPAAPAEPALPDYVAASADRFGALELSLSPRQLQRTRLKRVLTFTVRVDGAPLRRASVGFGDEALETDAAGRARMNYKPTSVGVRGVKATMDGYAPASTTLRIVAPRRR